MAWLCNHVFQYSESFTSWTPSSSLSSAACVLYKIGVEMVGRDGRVAIKDDAEREYRLWEAQVERVFAIVQRRHMDVIDLFRPELGNLLSRNVITQ